MNILCVGGGPAGLYLGILMKKADPGHRVRVIERNRPDDTFGFGVVFSDATLGNLAAADPDTYAAITEHFAHWDAIDTHVGGQVMRSRGHGFCGLERNTLLDILQRRCRELGVELVFDTELDPAALCDVGGRYGLAGGDDFDRAIDLIVAADGVGSAIRERFAEHFEPAIDVRPNKFVWLGTTYPFEAFTFIFKENDHGLFRVHAYRYTGRDGASQSDASLHDTRGGASQSDASLHDAGGGAGGDDGSTFIVECTGDTWRRAGLDQASEDDTIAYLEALFADELAGHRLIKNRSIWRSFPTVRNRTWHHQNIVLVGDAAHTAHFSIGSGTKLAMEDCIDLAAALAAEPHDLGAALQRYERTRRPAVEALQRAAQVSLEWFENTERYMTLPVEPFTFSLLTRSLRVTHENLKKRDPEFVARIDRFHEDTARAQCGLASRGDTPPAPPMFTPLRLREVIVPNRVVALSAELGSTEHGATGGVPGDVHVAHLGALALGGAGLVLTEPAAVTPEGRAHPGSLGMYSEECARSLARIVELVHRVSAAAMGLVLGHAGGSARMDRAGLERVRQAFARAAERAQGAGFDLVTLDFAHGSLLAELLSPRSNMRDDDYGGGLDERMRFAIEVVAAVRAVWPRDKPVAVRLDAIEWQAGGLEAGHAVRVAEALRAAGCDLIEVTAAMSAHAPRGRLVVTSFADRIRNEAGVMATTLDDIASIADINSILAAGRADLCAPTRALLFDPHFPRRAAWAQGYELPWPEPLAAARGFVPRD